MISPLANCFNGGVNSPPRKRGPVSKRRPKFLAAGGERLVYEIPGHPAVVVKVAIRPLEKTIALNAARGRPLDALPAEWKRRAAKDLRGEVARRRRLIARFGAEQVPAQRDLLAKVPVCGRMARALRKDGPPPPKEAWTVVSVQKRVAALADPQRLRIAAGYAEHGPVPEALYVRATEHLVFGMHPAERIDRRRFLQIQSHPDLKALLAKAGRDGGLRRAIREWAERTIAHVAATGELFDLAGKDNIVFFRRGGAWTCALVDVRDPGAPGSLARVRNLLFKLAGRREIGAREAVALLNLFNFVRTVNGLAELTGSRERIRLVPEGAGAKRVAAAIGRLPGKGLRDFYLRMRFGRTFE